MFYKLAHVQNFESLTEDWLVNVLRVYITRGEKKETYDGWQVRDGFHFSDKSFDFYVALHTSSIPAFSTLSFNLTLSFFFHLYLFLPTYPQTDTRPQFNIINIVALTVFTPDSPDRPWVISVATAFTTKFQVRGEILLFPPCCVSSEPNNEK